MKNFVFLTLLMACFAVSCNENSLEPEVKPELSVNEKIVELLNEQGYKSTHLSDGRIIFSGFNSKVDALIQFNKTFDELGLKERKFDLNSLSLDKNTNAKAEAVECHMSGTYDSGGARCYNMVCFGTHEEIGLVADYCEGGLCVHFHTHCYEPPSVIGDGNGM
ncbi:MAG: hypothetical protein AAFX87_16730 [Bacteroidota bacterium]